MHCDFLRDSPRAPPRARRREEKQRRRRRNMRALVVIVEGLAWSRQPRSECTVLIEQLLIYLNAYQLHFSDSLLTVLAPCGETVCCLWPPANGSEHPAMPINPLHARDAAAAGLNRLAADEPTERGSSGRTAPLLSAALSMALCRLHRVRRLHPKVKSRILVVHASPDTPTELVSSMNCVFGAQKMDVLIDAVLLPCKEDSLALQQAAQQTGGLYLRLEDASWRALGQYLITCCLSDAEERQLVRAPPQGKQETRALCFHSKRPIEKGHACSTCLTVFEDDKLSSCPICGSRFALMLPAGGRGKKRVRRTGGPPPAATAPA